MTFIPKAWVDGVSVFNATEGNRIEAGIGDVLIPSTMVPAGSKVGVLLSTDNAGGVVGPTAGTEYGIGIALSAQTWDQIGTQVLTLQAGSNMRFGLRPLAVDGSAGAPIVDQSVSGAATGTILTNFTATAIPTGLYILTWTRQNDAGNILQLQRGNAWNCRSVFSTCCSASGPANGHDPMIDILNTGVTGALPSTVVRTSVTTNVGSNWVPQVFFRRT